MGDHRHERGEMMLSYRYMHMSMDGTLSGTSSVSPDEVLDTYMVTPLRMPMTMHMFGAMVAPSDRVTFMAMLPYIASDMDHRTRAGGEFTTSASGIGDVSLTALVGLANANRQALHLNLGVRMPTGSIDERDITPASAPDEAILPYPMQVGSGTWDLQGGATYLGQTDRASWGAQALGTIRVGENDHHYAFGDRWSATAWAARQLGNWLSGSLRVAGTVWGDVEGADPMLNPMMVPTADASLRGGRRVDAAVGVNLEVPSGALDGQRLAVELVAPVWQDLHGPQLETDWMLVAGWQYAFPLWRRGR
jgi:hypothetical protein